MLQRSAGNNESNEIHPGQLLLLSSRDNEFGNTLFLTLVAEGNAESIAMAFDFLKLNPELHYQFTSVNSKLTEDACNTPLLLAVKNGDQVTACRLLPYYDAEALLHYDNNGQSAMQFACYMKLNHVVKAVLQRADQLGCKEDLLHHRNAFRFTPEELYQEDYQTPFSFREKNGMIGWGHPVIKNYEESIGKHKYQYDSNTHYIEPDILALLRPQSSEYELSTSKFRYSFFALKELLESDSVRQVRVDGTHAKVEIVTREYYFNK